MKDLTDKNFGIVIAFLLPGFVLLWGLSYSSPDIAAWLAKASGETSPSIGGFLYSALASLALGLVISAIRWVFIDHLLGWMDIKDPGIDIAKLTDKDKAAAFLMVVENHYRYYQYYANTLVAVIGAFVAAYVGDRELTWLNGITAFFLAAILFWGSADALKKYYDRAHAILS